MCRKVAARPPRRIHAVPGAQPRRRPVNDDLRDIERREPSSPGAAAGAPRRFTVVTWLLVVVAVVLVGWALRAAGVVAIPVIASLFIALAVAPVADWVKARVPTRLRRLGDAAAMAVVLLVLAAFFAGITVSAQQAVSEFGGLYEEVQSALDTAGERVDGGRAGETGGGPAAPDDGEAPDPADGGVTAAPPGPAAGADGNGNGLFRDLKDRAGAALARSGGDLAGWASSYATTVLNSVTAVIAALTLMFFLVLLMLIEAPRWRAKGAALMGDRQVGEWRDTMAVVAKSFRWYLIVRGALGAVTATLYVLWMWPFGVGLLLVWWVLTFFLNFIPTLGSIIAGVLPVLYALVTKDFQTALLVALGLLVIEQIMGNYVDPRMLGKQLSLSPLVTFVALVFWGWMWGVAGALLAVPITILFVIVGAHVHALRPLALLLSDETNLSALDKVATRR